MRPCKACAAAIPNNCDVCPECGAAASMSTYKGPPPETGPGVSGGPDERSETIGMIVPPLLVGVIATVIAINLWGPWGIAAGLLAGSAAFVIFACLHLL